MTHVLLEGKERCIKPNSSARCLNLVVIIGMSAAFLDGFLQLSSQIGRAGEKH